jgi:hypothetical protein
MSVESDRRRLTTPPLRGARADAIDGTTSYLFKSVSVLNATYQIRLLAFRAKCDGGRLVIRVPRDARIGESLRRLAQDSAGVIVIEKV